MTEPTVFTRPGLAKMSARALWVTGGVVVAAVALRYLAMFFGSNYDYGSFEVVGELQADGHNVYASTTRYNYGPVWFIVLGLLWDTSQAGVGDTALFRPMIVTLLIVADLAIGYLLLRRFGRVAATLFVLSPLSILITGYHNQFDNVAIAIGFGAVLLIGGERDGPLARRQWWGIALLGLSLIVKHVLFFLPLWMGLRQRERRRALLITAVPILMFAASFLPWMADGWTGVFDNVISYRSHANAPLIDVLTLGTLSADWLWRVGSVVFFAGMVVLGWVVRRLDHEWTFLAMLVAVVVLAPGVANQYLAIPMAAVAAAPNVFFGAWIAVSTYFLVGDFDGLGYRHILPPLLRHEVAGPRDAYNVPIAVLAAGALWWALQHYREPRRRVPR